MEKIVNKYLKVDFHIHSVYSKLKDGNSVVNNTIENVPVLIEKLEACEIDMISITDHNAFNYKLYKAIKKYEHNKLEKVLPGIEFDVEIENKRIHVVTIFDDRNEEKIKNIELCLNEEFDNNSKNAYSEQTFKKILKDIGLSVLLIAHQKSDVKSYNQNDNLASIGEEKFDEIIAVDYFDALEFRNGKVEGMLKDYKEEKHLNNLRYITGTDCHDWKYYPKQNKNDKTDITFSYLKILPTFKGLVMALTEPNRVSTVKNNIKEPFIDTLFIDIGENRNRIKLSSGINVLIGDNSIGKSMIFHALTNFDKCDSKTKNGYIRFMKKNSIRIKPFDNAAKQKIFFNKQGEIREMLQSGTKLIDIPFFSEKFDDIDPSEPEEEIIKYAKKVIDRIKQNDEFTKIKNALDYEISLPCMAENHTYHLRINDDLSYKENNYQEILKAFDNILSVIKDLENMALFIDNEKLRKIKKQLTSIENTYIKYNDIELSKRKACNIVKSICSEYEEKIRRVSEEQDNRRQVFNENINECCKRITDAIRYSNIKKIDVLEDFKNINLPSSKKEYGKYVFINRFIHKNDVINKEDIIKILCEPLSNIKDLDKIVSFDTIELFSNKLKLMYKDDLDYKDLYINAIRKYISSNIFKKETKIFNIQESMENDNSPGKNALLYLEVISNEKDSNIYMIDQPCDDISHMNITKNIIDIFRKMSDNKQILLITHKAELVVNLDVDNVIILKNDENNRINIYNGALEYEDKNINILKDVAYMLDGGEETIRRRWKRYDK